MIEFAHLTDAERMKIVFAQYLPGLAHRQTHITNCSILHVWRKTYRKNADQSFLTVLYELSITNVATKQTSQQLLYAKAYQNHRSQMEFRRQVNTRLSAPAFGAALTHIPALDMVVWSFPNDPTLPQLATLLDAEQIKSHLPYDQFPAGLGTPKDITDLKIQVVNYRPELRCTVRYECVGSALRLTLFGKTFADAQGKAIYARINTLWHEAQHNPAAFRIARPLAYNETTQTIWQEGWPGTPLLNLINQQNYQSLLAAVATGLSCLHNSPLQVANGITPDDHLAELQKKTAKLAQAFPHLRASLAKTLRELESSKPAASPLRLIHGDFHINQLLVSDSGIALFDFDEFALGDPLQDVANFIADLYAHPFEPAFIEAMAAALIQYGTAGGEDRLNWHLRVQFLTRAYRCLWQQKPDLERAVRFYLQLAQGGSGNLHQPPSNPFHLRGGGAHFANDLATPVVLPLSLR